MNYKDKVITLDSGNEYLVIEQINVNGKIYVYLVNNNNELDTMFCIIDEEGLIEKVDRDSLEFREKVYSLFVEKFKQYGDNDIS